VVGLRFTATTVVAVYLAYRAVMWLALAGMGFPESVLPFVMLVGAVCVDLAITHGLPGWSAAPVTALAVYGAGRLQDAADMLPPWNWTWWSIALVVASFTVLWSVVDVVARSSWFAGWREPSEPDAGDVQLPAAVGGASLR
jgi:hypothetical protein